MKKQQPTTEEYFQDTEAKRLLVENLETNLALTDLTSSEKKSLMRLNLIMIKQCMEDHGVE